MARKDGMVRCEYCSALNDMFTEQCVDCKRSVTTPTPRCSAWISGPKISRGVVAWRRQCRNRTNHPSGRCHQHRPAEREK